MSPDNDSGADRRRSPRKAVTLECRVEGLANNADLRLTDLSVDGGYVDARAAHLRPGDTVSVTIVIDGEELTLPVKVVHVHSGIGFAFDTSAEGVSDHVRERIAAYLDKV
jgi:PilZ domain